MIKGKYRPGTAGFARRRAGKKGGEAMKKRIVSLLLCLCLAVGLLPAGALATPVS